MFFPPEVTGCWRGGTHLSQVDRSLLRLPNSWGSSNIVMQHAKLLSYTGAQTDQCFGVIDDSLTWNLLARGVSP